MKLTCEQLSNMLYSCLRNNRPIPPELKGYGLVDEVEWLLQVKNNLHQKVCDEGEAKTKLFEFLKPYIRHTTSCKYNRGINDGGPDSDFCTCDYRGACNRVREFLGQKPL